MAALTNAGRGALHNDIVFFSEELIPEMFPANINYTRFNVTLVNVTWSTLSLFKAQGFSLYYVILRQSSTSGAGTTSDLIATNKSFAIFSNVSIDQRYSVVVGVTIGNSRSVVVNSDPLTGM